MIGPLSYIGGKNRLANLIISQIPPHKTYVEPFAGGAQVFFHKPPSKVEILNDLSDDIVNFFRICQSHAPELIRYVQHMVAARSWFALLQKMDPRVLTDIQRAARFFFLQKVDYGGLVAHRNFALQVVQSTHWSPSRIPGLIDNTARRLQNAQIEALPYQQIIRKCDRESTFFYFDPPYYGKKLYQFNFEKKDFQELAGLLAGLKGKFILSLNDVPEVRDIFRDFRMQPIQLAYSAQQKVGRRYSELMIKNF
jgi:DNA adenine methylase